MTGARSGASACPLCGSTALKPSPTWPDEVLLCLACESGFASDRESDRIDSANEEEFARFAASRPDRFFARLKNRRLLRELRELPEGARVLEIGPGAGEFLRALWALGYEASGLDMSASICSTIRDELGIEMHRGTVEDLAGTRSYDAVAAHHVIEHVSGPQAFLRQVHGLLRPRGLLLLSCPNLAAWAARLPGWGGYQRYHASYFTAASLVGIVKRAGFDVVRVRTRDPPGAAVDNLYRTLVTRGNPFQPGGGGRPAVAGDPGWGPGAVLKGFLAFFLSPAMALAGAVGWGDELILLARAGEASPETGAPAAR